MHGRKYDHKDTICQPITTYDTCYTQALLGQGLFINEIRYIILVVNVQLKKPS